MDEKTREKIRGEGYTDEEIASMTQEQLDSLIAEINEREKGKLGD